MPARQLTADLQNASTALTNADMPAEWGIVGASRVAERRFVPALRLIQEACRRAANVYGGSGAHVIYSRSANRAKAFAERCAIPAAVDELPNLLAQRQVRLVYIASQPRHHASQVEAALRAGKHVLCEPPLALIPEHAQRLVDMAARRSLTLAVNQIERARPIVQTLALLLEDDVIGDPLSLRISNGALLPLERQTWRLRPPNGGVFWERTLHSLDVCEYLLDDRVEVIAAHGGARLLADRNGMEQPAVEEEASVWLRSRRRRLFVHLHDALFVPHARDRIELAGAYGSLLAVNWTGRSGEPILARLRHGTEVRQALAAPPSPFDDPFVASVALFWAATQQQGLPPLVDAGVHTGQLQTIAAITAATARQRAWGHM